MSCPPIRRWLGAGFLLCLFTPWLALSATGSNETDLKGLIKGLGAKNSEAREETAQQLKEMGKKAKAAIPALKKAALQDSEANVRKAAEEALAAIGAPLVQDDFLNLLNDKNQPLEVRRNLCQEVIARYPEDQTVCLHLQKLLADDEINDLVAQGFKRMKHLKLLAKDKEAVQKTVAALQELTKKEAAFRQNLDKLHASHGKALGTKDLIDQYSVLLEYGTFEEERLLGYLKQLQQVHKSLERSEKEVLSSKLDNLPELLPLSPLVSEAKKWGGVSAKKVETALELFEALERKAKELPPEKHGKLTAKEVFAAENLAKIAAAEKAKKEAAQQLALEQAAEAAKAEKAKKEAAQILALQQAQMEAKSKFVQASTEWKGLLQHNGNQIPITININKRNKGAIEGTINAPGIGMAEWKGTIFGDKIVFKSTKKISGNILVPSVYQGEIKNATIEGAWESPIGYEKGTFTIQIP